MSAASELACAKEVSEYLKSRREKKESLSYLLQELRYKGWRGFSNLNAFESFLVNNGFTLERVYSKSGFVKQTNVCLPG